jgi:hypothetical protein
MLFALNSIMHFAASAFLFNLSLLSSFSITIRVPRKRASTVLKRIIYPLKVASPSPFTSAFLEPAFGDLVLAVSASGSSTSSSSSNTGSSYTASPRSPSSASSFSYSTSYSSHSTSALAATPSSSKSSTSATSSSKAFSST